MTSLTATAIALLFVLLPFANPTSAQAPAGTPAPTPQVSRRAETQAVIDACREKGRNAETRHTLMVFKAAQALLKVKSAFPEIADADTLTAEIATTLHDIGGGGLVNAHPGAVVTREVLTSLAETQHFSPAFIDKIERIVETHHITGAVKGKDDGPDWYLGDPRRHAAHLQRVAGRQGCVRQADSRPNRAGEGDAGVALACYHTIHLVSFYV